MVYTTACICGVAGTAAIGDHCSLNNYNDSVLTKECTDNADICDLDSDQNCTIKGTGCVCEHIVAVAG